MSTNNEYIPVAARLVTGCADCPASDWQETAPGDPQRIACALDRSPLGIFGRDLPGDPIGDPPPAWCPARAGVLVRLRRTDDATD